MSLASLKQWSVPTAVAIALLSVEILTGEGNSSRDLSGRKIHWPVFYLKVHRLSLSLYVFPCVKHSPLALSVLHTQAAHHI